MRCHRCGHVPTDTDKFCAECGVFLRDAFVDARLQLAHHYEREGRMREARREVERLLEATPDHALALHLLGSMKAHQGLLDDAVALYRSALRVAPRFARCEYDLGVAAYHRGNMREAADAFRRCLETDPHYTAAHYRLGLALFHAGELDDALEQFERSNAATPEFLLARYHIGVIHERRGNREAAARELRRSADGGVAEESSLHHLETLRRPV
jgi:tetratricopeptide (TPR) repeat protein